MRPEQLVINGDSYMELYVRGGGLEDLAQRLNAQHHETLCMGGCTNSRILRTTMKHSYQTPYASLYVLGLTFLLRSELPIASVDDPFERTWVNPRQQQGFVAKPGWSESDSATYSELTLKSAAGAETELLEDLVYRLAALRSDLVRRGHRLLVFNTANDFTHVTKQDFRTLSPMIREPYIVDRLQWRSIVWQQQQGAALFTYEKHHALPPPDCHHIAPGEHRWLNDFIVFYINSNKILS